MIGNTRQLQMNACVFLSEPPYQTSEIQNWSQKLEWEQVKFLAVFFAALSSYVMVYGKAAKMEKRISINNFIRA